MAHLDDEGKRKVGKNFLLAVLVTPIVALAEALFLKTEIIVFIVLFIFGMRGIYLAGENMKSDKWG